ncbi:hypothetical protein HBH98_124450 [Parastagonospora nodorum]|nr:hypothetical protein HBH53_118500 [Parastagonospora nodorum]KAH3970549.1 hypothetical protein HBH51_114910 [Parastagonospora nodorum]KAH4116213.1 hypothetical protein HBH47_170380 [Parastagonospora nodorum]KAH4345145.1 hypothetical protein HBH98_124450 [Parastagonospora nodorum]KAH4374904.1 hypothetical protein HBH97_121600 [Parastagonospora nodorum]
MATTKPDAAANRASTPQTPLGIHASTWPSRPLLRYLQHALCLDGGPSPTYAALQEIEALLPSPHPTAYLILTRFHRSAVTISKAD